TAQSGLDAVLAGRPCGPRQGTQRDDVALSSARGNRSRPLSGGAAWSFPAPVANRATRSASRIRSRSSRSRTSGRRPRRWRRSEFSCCCWASVFVFCRPLLLPVTAALVIGTTLAPIVKFAARHRISPWATAVVLGAALLAVAGAAVTLLAQPVSEWIAKAPEIGATIKQKLYVLDRPLAALRELQEVLLPSAGNAVAVEPSQLGIVTPVVAFVTPAVIQITLFFVTLIFFLATQMDFRRYMVSFFSSRDAKLRFLRISNDIED